MASTFYLVTNEAYGYLTDFIKEKQKEKDPVSKFSEDRRKELALKFKRYTVDLGQKAEGDTRWVTQKELGSITTLGALKDSPDKSFIDESRVKLIGQKGKKGQKINTYSFRASYVKKVGEYIQRMTTGIFATPLEKVYGTMCYEINLDNCIKTIPVKIDVIVLKDGKENDINKLELGDLRNKNGYLYPWEVSQSLLPLKLYMEHENSKKINPDSALKIINLVKDTKELKYLLDRI